MSHSQILKKTMNYKQIKTKITKRSILTALAGVMLLASCGSGIGNSTEHHYAGNNYPNPSTGFASQQGIIDFVRKVGGWGGVTAEEFMNGINEKARENAHYKVINGKTTAILPTKKQNGGKDAYLTLMGTDAVKTSRKLYQKIFTLGVLNKKTVYNLPEGLSGFFKELYDRALLKGNKHSKKAPLLYIMYQYLLMVDNNKSAIETATDKSTLLKRLEDNLNTFKESLLKVRESSKESQGIALIIPKDGAGAAFEDYKNSGKANRRAYTLNNKVMKIIDEIDVKAASELERLKTTVN